MAEDKSPQTPAKKSGRGRRWSYYLAALIVVVALVLYFTGHFPGHTGQGGSTGTTSAPPVGSGYLATTPGSVIFIQWNQAGTATSGVAQIVKVEGQAPNQTLAVKTAPVSGQINDSNVSVDFQGVTEVFGTTTDGGFTLDFPQPDGSLAPVAFKKASAQDYNTALAALKAEVDKANSGAPSTTSSS
jgi:hypothetical protein